MELTKQQEKEQKQENIMLDHALGNSKTNQGKFGLVGGIDALVNDMLGDSALDKASDAEKEELANLITEERRKAKVRNS